jgi:hypothetical protein
MFLERDVLGYWGSRIQGRIDGSSSWSVTLRIASTCSESGTIFLITYAHTLASGPSFVCPKAAASLLPRKPICTNISVCTSDSIKCESPYFEEYLPVSLISDWNHNVKIRTRRIKSKTKTIFILFLILWIKEIKTKKDWIKYFDKLKPASRNLIKL